MRISPERAQVKSNPDSVVVKTKTNFLDRMRGKSAESTSFGTGVPISREELLALAQDVKNKSIDSKEANERFVKTVVENSLKGKLGEEDRNNMVRDIERFCADDPEFVNNLIDNLSKYS